VIAQQLPSKALFVPTSDVIDVARAVARAEGFPVSNRQLFYVDLLASANSVARLPGFVSAAVYGNDHVVLEISINEQTGQVLDATRCLLFQFPEVLKFGIGVRKTSGARPLTQQQLEDLCGCKLKVESVPKQVPKR
jgi:hypothetical protein